MAVRIKFDSNHTAIEPTLVLSTRSGRKIGKIPAYNIHFKDGMNKCSEMSFAVNKKECVISDSYTDKVHKVPINVYNLISSETGFDQLGSLTSDQKYELNQYLEIYNKLSNVQLKFSGSHNVVYNAPAYSIDNNYIYFKDSNNNSLIRIDSEGNIYIYNANNIGFSYDDGCRIELSFDVPTVIVESDFWEQIKDFKLLWVREWDKWFELYVEIDESNDMIKNVSAKALGEAELSQINLYGIEINTETDISRDDYEPTVLFNANNPNASLLSRIIEKAPHYNIKYVDNSITNVQRTFTFDGTTIYDAFQDIAQEIDCLFVINCHSDSNGNILRDIYVYDLEGYCFECGERGSFLQKCNKCNSSNIRLGYGEDTNIFISTENLADNITYSTDNGAVKNCFKLEAGDDLMTATLKNCNPNGSSYLWYLSDEVKEDMSNTLVTRLEEYDETYNYYYKDSVLNIPQNIKVAYNNLITKYSEYTDNYVPVGDSIVGYPALMELFYNTIDFYLYLNNSLMPNVQMQRTTAALQAAQLNYVSLSPVAVKNIDTCSATTVESAVLAMAKTIVDNRYQVKIINTSFENNIWSGRFVLTNYSDEEDTATSAPVTCLITGDYQTYIKQRIDKTINNKITDNPTNIVDLFNLNNTDFKNELAKYSLQRLKAFYDCCESCLDILIEQGAANDGVLINGNLDLYNLLYVPYYNKLSLISSEITIRENEIAIIIGSYDKYGNIISDGLQTIIETRRNEIQDELNFEQYLGEELWLEFAAYRREDTYKNDNYISDGLDNSELIKRALEFIEIAQKDIYKSATLQHSISATLKNLLTIKEFEPIVDYFEIGNWIRIRVDNKVYRLRLLEYEIDFANLNNIPITFSDVTIVADGANDVESVLNQAASIATSYDAIARQASQGSKSKIRIDNWRQNGLDLTNMKIVNNRDNQDVQMDSHGILCREYDPVIEQYSDEQLKIVNNTMAITDNNWRSTKTAIGKFYYQDPVSGTYYSAYGINGEVVIGNLILGEQLGIYTEDSKLSFDRNGLEITNNVNTFKVNPSSNNLFVLSNEDNDLIYVSSTGELHIKGNGDIQSLNYVVNTSGMRIDLSSGAIDTKNFKVDSNGSATMKDVIITSGLIKSANYVANTSGTKIDLSTGTIDSKNFQLDSSGNITLSGGIIKSNNYATQTISGVVTATAGMRINLNNGSIMSKNFNVNSSGDVTLANATFTGGVIQSANYAESSGTVTAGTKINLTNGAISSKNFSVSSSGSVTMSSATLTGGIIKTSNYVYGSTGMQISLSSGTINTPNFYVNSSGNVTANNITLGSSNGNGTLSNINDDKTGVKLTNGRIELYHGMTESGTTTSKILGRITPIAWSTTSSVYDIYSRSSVNYNDSSSDITMSFLGSYNFVGLTFGYTSGSNPDVTPLYQINWGSKATSFGCTHLFRDTVKFVASKAVAKAGQFKSCVNFANNYGLAWGGNIGLRYWNTSASPTGLWLGIVGSDIDGNNISCPTVITGSQMNVKCSSVFNSSATFNYGIEMETCGINFDNNYGISWGGNIGLRYANSGVSRTGLWVGIGSAHTMITGGELHMMANVALHSSLMGMTGDSTWQALIRHSSSQIIVGNDNASLYLAGSNVTVNGSGIQTTSDKRRKNTISILEDKYLNLIRKINPVSFKYNDDISLSGRTHTGFIAQNVLQAMNECGIDRKDFAAFVDVNNNDEEYALRYEEFIALLLKYSQHLEERVKILEERLGV